MSTAQTYMNTIASKVPAILEKYGNCTLDEDYPHIAKYLFDFWGSTYFHEYIDSIMTHKPVSGRKIRAGFPLRAMQEIYLAIEAHNDRFPFLKPDEPIWY